jgi:small GTP-binding protein
MGFIYKIILGGSGSVGKSTLLYRLKFGRFSEDTKKTIGVDFISYQYKILDNGSELSLQIWDLAGQDRFKKLHPSYIDGAHAAILMHDLTRPETGRDLVDWVAMMREKNKNLPILLIGSKLDLVNPKEAVRFIMDPMFEVHKAFAHRVISSKTGEGVTDIFQLLGKELLRVNIKK